MSKRMRKSQKNQIENMLGMLDKAHGAIKKALETGNLEIAFSLLEQCQDSAIQIGGLIEESMGENFATIGMLESYCEQIYQNYELLRQNQSVNPNKIYKSLRKELIRIENSVKSDISLRTVSVFLPYKASMWDSLESVWKAADEDPNCDAYVIPIPYFDKNPDGSFREMHYEGNEYPNYVPITSWEEYDIVAEHPDMIFIHNPYDEFNLVTSVPPDYYAKKLKKCTDNLVYIPYFILNEIEPDNKQAVKGIEHFCAVPAVVYADTVVVQSEKMRQIYIDVMSETMGQNTRKIWEEKILGLGSPKIDRILYTEKENLDIPSEWLKIIEKPDGNRKKVIFYNTSVSALLQHSEKMLEKMMDVFQFFKSSQNELSLLWRPHPLIRATIESMRPQLWLAYEQIVEQYRAEGWGIYDDTADVDRAIAISDIYYGDPSSLVQMYERTGKPIILQHVNSVMLKSIMGKECNIGKLFGDKIVNLHYKSYVRAGDKLFFSEAFFNGLFQMDLRNFSVRFICHFSNEQISRILLHGGRAVLYKNIIYFFPLCARRVHYYHLTDEEENSIVVPTSDNKEAEAVGIVQRDNKVWMFCDPSKGVFVLNLEDQTITRADALNKLMADYGKVVGVLDIAEEKSIFTYSVKDSVLLEVNLEEVWVKEHKVPVPDITVGAIEYHAEMFYFIDAVSGDVYEWGWRDKQLRKYEACGLEKVLPEGAPFSGCCFMDDDIYMIPCRNKHVMRINRADGIMEKAFDYPQEFQYLESWREDYIPGIMAAGEVVGHEIWFHPYGSNHLLIYDTVLKQTTMRKVSIEAGSMLSAKERIISEAGELCGVKIYQKVTE